MFTLSTDVSEVLVGVGPGNRDILLMGLIPRLV